MTHLRLDPSVPRRVLRGQPEGVPPHGVQHAPPARPHAVEVGEGVGDGVDADVAHVQMAGGVREHVQYVILGLIRIVRRPVSLVLLPVVLPLTINGLNVKFHGAAFSDAQR